MPVLKDLNDYDEDVSKARKGESASAPALLPKSVLLGKSVEVGDKLILTIDKIMEDEIAVSYSTGASKETEEEEPKPTAEEEEPETSEPSEFGYD